MAIEKADVVHVMGMREPVSAAAALTARRSRVPYVIEPVGTHRRRVRSHRLKRAFDATTGKAILRDARAIIATSRMEATELIEDGIAPSSIRIRSNGICLDKVLPLPRRGQLRATLRIPQEAPLVLFLGRIAAKKQLLHLVHALDRLPGVWALIAGPDYHDGTLQAIESLRARLDLEDRLLLVPEGLWDGQKAQALADADCFCLPSESENFGTAALEAAGVGLPVVLSDRCGGAELLGPQASVVFDYGDIAGLALALRRCSRTVLRGPRLELLRPPCVSRSTGPPSPPTRKASTTRFSRVQERRDEALGKEASLSILMASARARISWRD